LTGKGISTIMQSEVKLILPGACVVLVGFGVVTRGARVDALERLTAIEIIQLTTPSIAYYFSVKQVTITSVLSRKYSEELETPLFLSPRQYRVSRGDLAVSIPRSVSESGNMTARQPCERHTFDGLFHCRLCNQTST